MNDVREKLRTAIESVIGPAPYVLIFDSTPLDDLLDGDRTSFDYAEPENQSSYTSLGLVESARVAYMPKEY